MTYNLDWKTPVTLFYARKDLNDLHGCEPQVVIPREPLLQRLLNDQSLSHAKVAAHVHKPRTEDDVPGKGDLVALDAEFVSLAKEDAEIRSGGVSKSTVKPAHMVRRFETCSGVVLGCPTTHASLPTGLRPNQCRLWVWPEQGQDVHRRLH